MEFVTIPMFQCIVVSVCVDVHPQIAGAAAEEGRSLQEVTALAQQVADNIGEYGCVCAESIANYCEAKNNFPGKNIPLISLNHFAGYIFTTAQGELIFYPQKFTRKTFVR